MLATRRRKCYAVIIAALVIVPVALAAWLIASGDGVTNNRFATAEQLTLSITSPVVPATGTVEPGQVAKLISVNVGAPSYAGGPLLVSGIALNGKVIIENDPPSCQIDGLVTLNATQPGIGTSLPSSQTTSVPVSIDVSTNLPVCASGQVFTIPLRVTATATG